MSDDSQPPWHRLPEDPVGFFGLPEEFDRKELKRAYNTLLRRFKPDQFPQEFQKLRAAFEQLDGQLRYGQPPPRLPGGLSKYQWGQESRSGPAFQDSGSDPGQGTSEVTGQDSAQDTAHDSAQGYGQGPAQEHKPDKGHESAQESGNESARDSVRESGDRKQQTGRSPEPDTGSPDTGRPVPPAKTLAERVATESLDDLYRELKQRPQDPYDYYVLALLSDSVAGPEEMLFLQWILAGLKRFPGHPALTQLLLAYFQEGHIPDHELAAVLEDVSRTITNDSFYFMTEKLFDRLSLQVPWHEFQRTLTACEANIVDHQVRSRVVLMCHLTRRALWLAPIEESQRLLSYLNDHHQYLNNNLEYELELNTRLLAYIEARESFLAKGPIAQMIDHALKRYCLDTDGLGDYEIVKTQVYIAQHPEQLFKEFGLAPDENMQLLVPWVWIGDEVEDRLETQEPVGQFQRTVEATMLMLRQIDNNFPVTPIQVYNLLCRGIPLGICLVLVIFLPVLVAIITEQVAAAYEDWLFRITFVIGSIVAALFWFRWQHRTVSVWMAHYLRRLLNKHYLGWWRSLIGRFFAATHYPYRQVDRAIDSLVEVRREQLNVSCWLPHFYSRDVALLIYASAVRFQR
ncbi:MAG: J domain-containing protein [Pirellulaceae bacterium]|nr:J domain-containing protein [Pirellulaceae bacterium]